jgi:hypothetical protein
MKYQIALAIAVLFLLASASSSSASMFWQYNETADQSGNEGSCTNPTNVYDNNWGTYGYGPSASTCRINENWTLPSVSLPYLNISLASLLTKDDSGNHTVSFPSNCTFGNSKIELVTLSVASAQWHIVGCRDNTGQLFNFSIWTGGGGYPNAQNIYENGVNWYVDYIYGGYNFSTYDEEDGSSLVFNMTISNSTNISTYTGISTLSAFYQNLPTGSVEMTFYNYSGSGYVSRTMVDNIQNVTGTHEIKAYILKAASASLINFIVVNNLGSSIQGATVTVEKQISGTWTVMTSKTTDSTGNAGIYLNPTTQYRIIVTASGYNSMTNILTPTNPPYQFSMSSGGVGTYQTDWSWITYMIEPYRGLYANTTEPITLTINDERSDLALFGMNVTAPNGTVVYSHQEIASTSGGQIFGSINLTGATAFQQVQVKIWFQRIGYDLQTYTKTYVVFNPPGSAYTLKWSMDQLGAQLDPFEKAFVSIIITFVIMIALAMALPSLSKEGIAYVGLGVLAIFTYLTWFNLIWLIVLAFITLGLKLLEGRL